MLIAIDHRIMGPFILEKNMTGCRKRLGDKEP